MGCCQSCANGPLDAAAADLALDEVPAYSSALALATVAPAEASAPPLKGAEPPTAPSLEPPLGHPEPPAAELPPVQPDVESASERCHDADLPGASEEAEAICEEELQLRALIDEALAEATTLVARGDLFAAERTLAATLQRLMGAELSGEGRRALTKQLRCGASYRECLQLLREYEEGAEGCVGHFSPDSGWQLIGDIPVDYPKLGLQLSPEADAELKPELRYIKMYYKRENASLNLTVRLSLPTLPTNATRSFLAGWVAMNHETELFESWHPIIHGKGPIELQPRQKNINLWLVLVKIMFIKQSQMSVQQMIFNHEAGTFSMHVTDLPSSDPRWKAHDVPASFKEDPNKQVFRVLAVPQEHTTLFCFNLAISLDAPPPDMILRFLVSWVLPEMARRLLTAGAAALTPGGSHDRCMVADKEGIYAETASLIEEARRRDRERKGAGGHCYTPAALPAVEAATARELQLTRLNAALDATAPPRGSLDCAVGT